MTGLPPRVVAAELGWVLPGGTTRDPVRPPTAGVAKKGEVLATPAAR